MARRYSTVISFEKKNLSEQDFRDAFESVGFTTGKIVKVDEYITY